MKLEIGGFCFLLMAAMSVRNSFVCTSKFDLGLPIKSLDCLDILLESSLYAELF